jgi:hypothetical protein
MEAVAPSEIRVRPGAGGPGAGSSK